MIHVERVAALRPFELLVTTRKKARASTPQKVLGDLLNRFVDSSKTAAKAAMKDVDKAAKRLKKEVDHVAASAKKRLGGMRSATAKKATRTAKASRAKVAKTSKRVRAASAPKLKRATRKAPRR